MNKTIATISTPLGKGAISIIRMTGDECLKILSKVFFCKNLKVENIEERKMYLGNFQIEENVFEKCFMVYFKNPNSYTGEDLIEFQIHGNIILTQKILEKLLEKGCVLAEAGEFSKIAFLNGKISLDEAESIVDIIESESESQLKANLKLSRGGLFQKIQSLQNLLTENLAKIEAVLDYPEEDFDEDVREEIFQGIDFVEKEIDEIFESSECVKYIKNGISVALVGQTNVGKSSVLNALLSEEKAIVTDIEGTTRDFVEGSFSFNGVKINLIDTAGIRQSDDKVEKIGIQKSLEIIGQVDLILFIFDASREICKEDIQLLENKKGKNFICVVNKCDQKRRFEKQEIEIEISALKGTNIKKLKEEIYNMVIKNQIDFNKIILTNERHINELKNCKKIIQEISEANNDLLEGVAFLIKKLWNNLGKITGNTENEDIIDLIFSKFCLGK